MIMHDKESDIQCTVYIPCIQHVYTFNYAWLPNKTVHDYAIFLRNYYYALSHYVNPLSTRIIARFTQCQTYKVKNSQKVTSNDHNNNIDRTIIDNIDYVVYIIYDRTA